jgi:hypothetical protein
MAETPRTEKNNKIQMKPTSLPHIFLIDIDDTGILRECAVIAQFPDGTINYVIVDTLHQIDKARLKKILTSPHATKYDLWELMSQNRLSNGLNALEYFHSNFVKQKRPKGAKMSQDSLANLNVNISDRIIGSEFTNPAEASLDMATKQFI